ncbi:MAG: JAB domain-containing protein, partial [Clostridia bacterium]|nr:JAB domain-containing protein [Clostridia bacterium]
AKQNRYSMARSDQRIDFFVPKFVGATEEQLYAAFLDKSWNLIGCEMICKGSIDALKVEMRKLLDVSMRRRAAIVVLAHNHFAHSNPSTEDIMTTQSAFEKLGACDIVLADHIVVCGNKGVSMSAKGLIRHVR